MQIRREPFINEEIYHIYNKTLDSRNIFKDASNCELLLDIARYYRSSRTLVSYSRIKNLDSEKLAYLIKEINKVEEFLVQVVSYCIMPNHIHFLIKQKKDGGVQRFISNTVNSFTKTFNLNNKRVGPLFLPRFKAVRVNSEEQFKHVSRYIHLNPYSGRVVKSMKDLEDYRWTSLWEYINKADDPVSNFTILLGTFNNNLDLYKRFVFNNAEHQRTLELAKHVKRW